MFDCSHNQVRKLLQLGREALCDKTCSRRQSHFQSCDRCFNISGRCCFGFKTPIAARRSLPFGQTVDMIIHQHISYIHITPDSMIGMPQANRHTIAVTATGNNIELRIGKFQTLRKRQRSSVCGVHAISIYIARKTSAAANAADNRKLMWFQAKFHRCLLQGCLHSIIAAAWAPVRFHIISEVLQNSHLQHLLATHNEFFRIHDISVILQNAFQMRAAFNMHT